MSGIVEVAQNSLYWIFFVHEAVGDGTCNLKKRFKIHVNLAKAMEFTGSVDE